MQFKRKQQKQLRLERLEHRRVLATFAVTQLSDSGAGSLRQAISDANTNPGFDTVELASGLTGVISLDDGEIIINDDLQIDGSGGEVTIDAAGVSRLFNVVADTSVSMNDLALTGGFSTSLGGAITNAGDLTLTRITASANAANGGGAIFNSGELVVDDSDFTANTVLQRGGAIHNTGSSVFTNTRIMDNIASNLTDNTTVGGGVYSDGGRAEFFDSQIIGNEAEMNVISSVNFSFGGGIAGAAGEIVLNNTLVEDNHSFFAGGVYIQDGTLTVADSDFFANVAENLGGAVRSANSTLLVDDSLFEGNDATNGSGIYAAGQSITVSNSEFRENTGTIGGGITARQVRGTISDTLFERNTVTGSAGAVFVDGGDTTMDIFDSQFLENSAMLGGAIFGDTIFDDLNVHRSVFTGNSATLDGGAIYYETNTLSSPILDVFFTDTTIDSNTAGRNGGGIYLDGERGIGLMRTTISNNTAVDGGGVHVHFGRIVIENSTLSGNSAERGGGIFDFGFRTTLIELVSATVVNNYASLDTGGLFSERKDTAQSNSSVISIEDSLLAGNYQADNVPSDLTTVGEVTLGEYEASYSLIGFSDDSFLAESAQDANGNQVGGPVGGAIDAVVGPLADNGGQTETHALLEGSPAIDAGNPDAAMGLDQRGKDRIVNGRIDVGSYEFFASTSGDFDLDGDYDCDDVNQLTAAIASGAFDVVFDLNSDGVLDSTDLEMWLSEAGDANIGAAYLPGDANLDGFVDTSDFNIWNDNKFTANSAWCSGNFSGDGSVDSSDFNIWNENKFTSSDAIVPVFEISTSENLKEKVPAKHRLIDLVLQTAV